MEHVLTALQDYELLMLVFIIDFFMKTTHADVARSELVIFGLDLLIINFLFLHFLLHLLGNLLVLATLFEVLPVLPVNTSLLYFYLQF